MSKLIILRSFTGLTLAFCGFTALAFGQGGGATSPAPAPGGNTGSAPGGGASIPGRGNNPGNTQPRMPDTPPPMEMPQPVFLSGKVQMDDGTPPPSSVIIERVCNGSVRPEGYTNAKGHFSFSLGQNNAVLADASNSGMSDMGGRMGGVPSNFGGLAGSRGQSTAINLMGCEIRANLPGFRSDVISLAGRRPMDNSEVGTIILHRMGKVEGYTFSGTSSYAPRDAKKAYEKGLDAVKKNKLEDAEVSLQKAVDIYPKYAVAWYELGTIYQKQKKLEDAARCYQEALKADGKYVSPYVQLTRLAASTQNWEMTADYSGKLLKLNPYVSPEMFFYSAVANLNIHKLDIAEEHAREGLKMDSQNRNPRMNQVLGVVLAQKSDFLGAAASMKTYLKLAPNAPDLEQVKKQLEEIEKQLPDAAASAKKPE